MNSVRVRMTGSSQVAGHPVAEVTIFEGDDKVRFAKSEDRPERLWYYETGVWQPIPGPGNWAPLRSGQELVLGDREDGVRLTVRRCGRRWLARRYEVSGLGATVYLQAGFVRSQLVRPDGTLIARDLPTRVCAELPKGERVLIGWLIITGAARQLRMPLRILFSSVLLNS